MRDDSYQASLQTDGSGEMHNPFATQATGSDSLPLRRRLPLGETFGGDRDIYETLGYDDDLEPGDYWNRYLRQDLARTIVDAPAQTTWREKPEVTDDDDDEEQTAFEEDIQTLFRDHELLAKLEAIDRLAGIGRFGVLVLGVADGRELSEPVNTAALSSPDDLAYIMPIAEDRVEDWDLVVDETDERFGLPETYDIDFSQRDRLKSDLFSVTSDDQVHTVHHERVIHVPAGNTLDNLLFGRPRLEAVFNRLQDLEKVVGASAEMMWRAADYGLALKADPEHAGKLNDERKDDLEQELQRWYHGLQPFLRLSGFDVDKLGGENPKPEGVFDALIKLIAGETGIPQRILTGSERGELASTQDRVSWLGRISERQTNYAEPKIFRPFVDRMTDFGIVTEAGGNVDADGAAYAVEWPNLFELSDTEQAEVTAQKAKALKDTRDPARGEPVMTTGEVRQEIFGLDPEVGAEVDIDEDAEADDPLADILPPDQRGDPEDDRPVDEDDEDVQEQFRETQQADIDRVLADGGRSPADD